MTFLHRSTLAFRHLTLRNRDSRCKRLYTQLSPPAFKSDPSVVPMAGRSAGSNGDSWFIPLALAVLGLGFSTFSTHQLMTCRDARIEVFTDPQHIKK